MDDALSGLDEVGLAPFADVRRGGRGGLGVRVDAHLGAVEGGGGGRGGLEEGGGVGRWG